MFCTSCCQFKTIFTVTNATKSQEYYKCFIKKKTKKNDDPLYKAIILFINYLVLFFMFYFRNAFKKRLCVELKQNILVFKQNKNQDFIYILVLIF